MTDRELMQQALEALRREWVGLTEEEIKAVIRAGEYDSMEEFARAIETKLKGKNA